jgi:hypothetical protein
MSWRFGSRNQPPRSTASPATRREERGRAEAAGLATIEHEAKLRRQKSEKLKKLREARDAAVVADVAAKSK